MGGAALRKERDIEATAPCGRCGGVMPVAADICPACKALLPPRAADHFRRLDLPIGFELEAKTLERRYLDLQRRYHPDRFARGKAEDKANALRHAAALNEAYETLRAPLRRALYLIGLLDPSRIKDAAATEKDPALLMEALERREELAEAMTAGASDAVLARAARDAEGVVRDLAASFARRDLAGAERLAARLKFLDKLADDARARRRVLSAG